MAQIKQVGTGRKSSGTIDGITYYTVNGKTFARSTPTMPASVYNTPDARTRQAIFKMVQMHIKHHLRTIRKTITNKTVNDAVSNPDAPDVDPIVVPGDDSKKNLWKFILQTLISILTAILTVLDATSCMGLH